MPILGSIGYGSREIPFLAARTDSGYINEIIMDVAEELTSPGVEARRWRTIHGQFPYFKLFTISEYTNYAAAIKAKNSAEYMVNVIGHLSLTLGGSPYNFQKLYFASVKAEAAAGPVVAAGSTGGSAHLMCEWTLCMCDLEQNIQGGS